MTSKIRNKLLAKHKVYIGWLSCKIQDYLLVTKCYKCQGYGHIAKHCEKEECCSHCAGTGHKISECPNKSGAQKCTNCARAKKDHTHDSMDKKCPLYKQALERLINATDYGL